MKIEIKKSIKPVNYKTAINFLEDRVDKIEKNEDTEFVWVLEHNEIYTGGSSYKENEILDKSINLIKTNRGGKLTYHGPGQLVCYFGINLRKRKKDIRKFITLIENTIIESLSEFNIDTFADKKNIGIWYKDNYKLKKVAAIGIRVSKWIAYHGFSINVNNNLNKYKSIIPCGISNKEVTNLIKIKEQDYRTLKTKIINNFIKNLKV